MVVINIYGSPGCGKSTAASYLFYQFKTKTKLKTELVTEYAKDLTYDDRIKTLSCQPYVFGKQLYKLDRLRDKVDVAITDSPLLLSCLYSKYSKNYNLPQLIDGYFNAYNTFNNISLLLSTDKVINSYAAYGRSQSAQESLDLYDELVHMLDKYEEPYIYYDDVTFENLVEYVMNFQKNKTDNIK